MVELQINLTEISHTNPFAKTFLSLMERRKKSLFENDAFKAAIFIDPRFNYLRNSHLSVKNQEEAKVKFFSQILFYINYFLIFISRLIL
jgi:hypothetical protein